MKGAELSCAKCGAGAKDVAPDFEMDPQPGDLFHSDEVACMTYWHCANGHLNKYRWIPPHRPNSERNKT